jgi:pilus assembly protein Flp/PilA
VKILKRLLKDQSGATAIEYALIVAMIFLVIVTAVEIYAQHTNTLYTKIGNAVTGAGG